MMRLIYIIIFFFSLSSISFSQHKNVREKKPFLKQGFYVNASFNYVPYDADGFYKQSFLRSLGLSFEGSVYIKFFDIYYIQMGIRSLYHRSYNYRYQGNIKHQVVSHAFEISIPSMNGFIIGKNKIFFGSGFRVRLSGGGFYRYRIYENNAIIYNDKSKFLQRNFALSDIFISLFSIIDVKIKDNLYVSAEYQFLFKPVYFVGITYRFE